MSAEGERLSRNEEIRQLVRDETRSMLDEHRMKMKKQREEVTIPLVLLVREVIYFALVTVLLVHLPEESQGWAFPALIFAVITGGMMLIGCCIAIKDALDDR